jgi:hypothetical protein
VEVSKIMKEHVRRIITGHNDRGKSTVWYDGPPVEYGDNDDFMYEMWVTDQTPADNAQESDTARRKTRLEPPPNGSILRFFEVLPEDSSLSGDELERLVAAEMVKLDAEHCRPDTSRDPWMHQTKTLDYIILLRGEVTLLLDEGKVHLKPFDVVVQRGTNHAWINHGSQKALLAAILIDAEPTDQLGA